MKTQRTVAYTRRHFLRTLTSAGAIGGGLVMGGCGGDSDPAAASTPAPGSAPQNDSTGLDFPGSAAVGSTVRFRFRNPLAIYPATYIWRAFPRHQAGYYTAFFWGNDDGLNDVRTFRWTETGRADSYYGAHPYPIPPPLGTVHRWEIAILETDITNGDVVYDRWYTQAMRVWADQAGKHHEFYWDLPNLDARVTFRAPPDWGNRLPPAPALTWGDAPWAPGNEVWNGILRGFQIYSTTLSPDALMGEVASPLSTDSGRDNVWYLNLDPRPDDISDRSGRGHQPEWVGALRPRMWTGSA